jgi:hypothetical protein
MAGSDADDPGFESDFLAEVWAALARRRKAIRYRVRGLAIEAVVGGAAGKSGERVEVLCPVSRAPSTLLSLYLWHDRWCRIDARSGWKGKGWAWAFGREGRPLLPPDGIVAALEASITAASPVEQSMSAAGRYLGADPRRRPASRFVGLPRTSE